MMVKIFFVVYAIILMVGSGSDSHSIIFHYGQAAFGWLLYVVGRLFFTQDIYDKNGDGLDRKEIGVYWKKNRIAFIFNGLLLIAVVPYTPELWKWGVNDYWGKDWVFSDFAYLLVGSFILVLQIIVDVVKSKLKKLNS